MARHSKKSTKQKKPSRFKRFIKIAFWTSCAISCVLILIGFIVGKGRLNEAEQKIPNLSAIMQSVLNTPSVIVSADGEELYVVQNEYRTPADIEDIPQIVIDSTIAAEDKRFYEHDGIDYVATAGVLYHLARNRNLDRGGASTLTMQIAKRVYTSPIQTIDRKLDDMALAVMIERALTKDQILELYLNQVYYGERSYGIGAAAETYFDKTLDELTISEAATLARLVRRPSKENPFVNLEKATKNRNVVLKLMLDQEKISQSEYDEAKAEAIMLAVQKPAGISGKKKAPYFVDSVIRQLKKEHPEIDLGMGGYRIETTLIWELQEPAEQIINDAVENLKSQKVTTAAMIVLDSEGRIITHIGGADYNRNQYDVVWQGARQPGSSFKPIMYSTAFEHNIVSPYDMISNEEYKWEKSWGKEVFVKNSNGKYGGEMSVEYAIKWSVNIPAARVMEMTGPANVVSFARNSFGFTSHLEAVPALALGATAVSPLEMARAYSVFKTGGDRLEPWQIVRVVGPDGHTIKRYSPKTRRNVLSRKTAKTMDTILYAAGHSGTARRVTTEQGVVNARGKTGTTNSYRDAWLCGYTDQFIAIAWVGNEVRKDGEWLYEPMSRVFGGTSVAPFWGKVVKNAQDLYGEKHERFRRFFPDTAIYVELDSEEENPLIDNLPPLDRNTIPPIGGTVVVDPPKRTTPPTDNRTLNLISMLICRDSRELGTIYCPKRTNATFVSGSEPTEDCPIHKPIR